MNARKVIALGKFSRDDVDRIIDGLQDRANILRKAGDTTEAFFTVHLADQIKAMKEDAR